RHGDRSAGVGVGVDAGPLPGPSADAGGARRGSRRAGAGRGGGWPDAGPRRRLIDPIGALDFLALEADAGAVLTDAGGIQEETTYLGVPCFTLRANTDGRVTIRPSTNTLLGLVPAAIAGIPAALADRPPERPDPPPLWDGNAAERI